MTSFLDTWNGAYEGLPADNEDINQGASRIRDFKVNIRERVAVDHSFAGDANDGKHTQSSYRVQTVDPPADAGEPSDGFVYTKAVGGNTELFYKDSSGSVIQLTSSGALHTQPFPSGTVMLFGQPSPPVGWTQNNINDHLIRTVADGSGGGVGGNWNISGLNASTSTSVTTNTTTNITAVNMTFTGNPFTIGTTNLPAHTHNVTVPAQSGGVSASAGGFAVFTPGSTIITSDGGPGTSTPITPSGSVSFSSGTASSSSSSSASSSTSVSGDGSWRPTYMNVLVATKS